MIMDNHKYKVMIYATICILYDLMIILLFLYKREDFTWKRNTGRKIHAFIPSVPEHNGVIDDVKISFCTVWWLFCFTMHFLFIRMREKIIMICWWLCDGYHTISNRLASCTRIYLYYSLLVMVLLPPPPTCSMLWKRQLIGIYLLYTDSHMYSYHVYKVIFLIVRRHVHSMTSFPSTHKTPSINANWNIYSRYTNIQGYEWY